MTNDDLYSILSQLDDPSATMPYRNVNFPPKPQPWPGGRGFANKEHAHPRPSKPHRSGRRAPTTIRHATILSIDNVNRVGIALLAGSGINLVAHCL